MPMNMATIARSPKPGLPDPFPFPWSFLVYLGLKIAARIIPHMMQTLISRAMVEKACTVIWSALSLMPICSAAASATWVS